MVSQGTKYATNPTYLILSSHIARASSSVRSGRVGAGFFCHKGALRTGGGGGKGSTALGGGGGGESDVGGTGLGVGGTPAGRLTTPGAGGMGLAKDSVCGVTSGVLSSGRLVFDILWWSILRRRELSVTSPSERSRERCLRGEGLRRGLWREALLSRRGIGLVVESYFRVSLGAGDRRSRELNNVYKGGMESGASSQSGSCGWTK
jgi:hypothetical protein